MNLFRVTWVNYGELDNSSTDFCSLTYDVSEHLIFYETCNGIRHALRCDFGSIFDKIHCIVSSEEFQSEKPYTDGCDGDWYKFEYTLNGEEIQYEGYIYGLKYHEEVVSLIKSCAKGTLEDERKLLRHECTDNEVENIINSRKKLEEDFLDCWKDICTINIRVPVDFVKCPSCGSIIHNKYYKNRKYWGRVWLSDKSGDYEVEYDSGECPVCGQLNTELPYTGIEFQPEEDLFESNNKAFTIEPDENSNKLYTFDELSDLLKHLSDEDKVKVIDCQFKVFETSPDDDSGDVYYYITIFKGGNEVGTIDMLSYSSVCWELLSIEEQLSLSDDTQSYSYTMTLNEDSKENTKTPFDDTFSSKNSFDASKDGFDIQGKWSPFDDSKFRCKKCGKIFCICNTFFSRRD